MFISANLSCKILPVQRALRVSVLGQKQKVLGLITLRFSILDKLIYTLYVRFPLSELDFLE